MISRIAFLLLWAGAASAATVQSSRTQFNARYGSVTGSYTAPGLENGDINVSTALDVSLEYFTGAKDSVLIHMTFAEDFATALLPYLYIGLSRRFYFMSYGMRLDAEESRTRLTISSPWRYYWGLDGGIAKLAYQQLQVFELSSTTLELGAHLGTIYQVSPSLGISAELSYAPINFGFTSVALNGSTRKILVGVAYYF